MYLAYNARRRCAWLALVSYVSTTVATAWAPLANAQQLGSVVHQVAQATERLEMTVNTSQILTLGARIPRIVVNNPELVTATPLSETQVQIAARKPGVTQINLWDENGQIYTIDLLIFGDVRELQVNLKRMFPASSINVIRLTNSLVLEGQVDRPDIVTTVFRLAEDYAPKVVSNLTVAGAQQVLLKVKVMEVSRSKAREAGFDFNQQSGGSFFSSTAAGGLTNAGQIGSLAGTTNLQFGIVNGNNSFFGFLQFLQQNQLVKTLADPTLVTVSGRPATFNSGGEIFFQINNGVSGSTVESEKFGTQVDFLPIVLGNGRIRLEVRPKISDIDNSVELGNELFRTKVSEVDTGVEMMSGQTLALAGLIQTKVTGQKRGIPYLNNIPVVGNVFGGSREDTEEVELLILVTPEFAEAMAPHEVPPCGPGMETMSPSDGDLYWRGKIEVPACGPCGANDPCFCNAPGLACQNGQCGTAPMGPAIMATDGAQPLHMGPAHRSGIPQPTPMEEVEVYDGQAPGMAPLPNQHGWTPRRTPAPGPQVVRAASPPPQRLAAVPQPAYRDNPVNPQPSLIPANRTTSTPGLIGPLGYDVQK